MQLLDRQRDDRRIRARQDDAIGLQPLIAEPETVLFSKSTAASAIVGTNLTYTIAATNNGPSNATGVSVGDTLPAGLTFVSPGSTQGSCNAASPVTCNIGSLNVGGSATVTITAAVSSSLRGSLDNTATVSVTQSDSNAFNNSSTASTTVVGRADLSVVKSDSPDP